MLYSRTNESKSVMHVFAMTINMLEETEEVEDLIVGSKLSHNFGPRTENAQSPVVCEARAWNVEQQSGGGIRDERFRAEAPGASSCRALKNKYKNLKNQFCSPLVTSEERPVQGRCGLSS